LVLVVNFLLVDFRFNRVRESAKILNSLCSSAHFLLVFVLELLEVGISVFGIFPVFAVESFDEVRFGLDWLLALSLRKVVRGHLLSLGKMVVCRMAFLGRDLVLLLCLVLKVQG